MTEGATGLEPTIEITDADYPEIMRIVASDGEVDNYLASAGVARDVFGDDTDDGTALCVPERAALGGPLLYVVEVGEVAGTSDTEGALMLPASAATSLLASVNDVASEGLKLADCLEGVPSGCRGRAARDVRAARARRRPTAARGRGAHGPGS